MRLLDRYLLREFLVPLGFCLGGFLIFWIAFDMFSELRALQEERLLARDIAEYYFFRIPEFLPIALPVALLLALLYALTNHARHHEITAIRAAGVSLGRLCAPYFAVGILAGAGLFLMNEWCAPRAADMAERIRVRRTQRHLSPAERQQFKNLAFFNAAGGRFWRIGIYNLKTGEMIKPHVDWQLPHGLLRIIDADRAVRTNGVWTFYRVREIKQYATNAQVKLAPVEVLAFPEFSETPRLIKSEINITDRYGNQSRTYRADIPLSEIRNYLRLNPRPEPGLRAWLYTKMHGRIAAAFTCLVVVLIAIPFAAASGRRNVFAGVAASITIFFVFFFVQQFGLAFGQSGQIAPWLGAWLANIIFGVTGLVMLARVR
jgi:lipopolysaccharide export system permease protein